ncbi:MAG: class I SAM-dependent methyltransferase [Bacteroidetes bacterium]|nr:MAG: class I SAM-dependent methyltransferase [Bacteroidota bacterium]
MDYLKKNFENLYELEKNKLPGVGSFVWENLQIPADVKSILDVGCWRGEFLNSLPDTYEKTGVDIVSEALKNVKCKTIACSVEELPFPSSSFDLVTSFEVLEHLPSDIFPKSVSEIERVSRKYIAVSVPNNQMLKQAFVKCSYCRCLFNPDYHVRSFDISKLQKLFKKFSPVSCIECGPLISDYPSFVNFLTPLIGIKPKPNTVCPQCGYTEKSENKISNESSITENQPKDLNHGKSLLSTLKSYIRQNKRPYCLLTLYKRNE